jgi:hypothetical protein
MSADEPDANASSTMSPVDAESASGEEERFFPAPLTWREGSTLGGVPIFVPGDALRRLADGEISEETARVYISFAGEEITIRTELRV